MGPAITVVHDTDSNISRRLGDFSCPERGVIAVDTRPNLRHLGWLVADVLAATGRSPVSSFGSDGWPIAAAYATALFVSSDIVTLVVGSAQTLTLRHLSELAGLAHLSRTNLVLVADTAITDAIADFAGDWGIEVLRGEAALEALDTVPDRPGICEGQTAPASLRPLPRVPEDDALTFLAACRRALGHSELTAIEEEFSRGFETLKGLAAGDNDLSDGNLVEVLRELLGEPRDRAGVVARARGVQAAGLQLGWLIRIDIDHFLRRSLIDDLQLHLTPEDWATISTASDPQGAAAAALAGAGLDPTTITSVTASEVCPSGSWVLVDGDQHPIPDPARSIIVAHSVFRALVTPSDADQFCMGRHSTEPLGPRAVATLLSTVTSVTGIRLRLTHSDWTQGRQSWANKWGVNVRSLK